MQEAIELLKKVLANEGDIGMHIEWNVGFREGIEHCIATLEAAQQSVQADGADICPHCGRLNKLHCGCNEVAE